MRRLLFWAFAAATLVALPARADAPALAGTVRAAGAGALEGVLVTARRAGATIAVTVVSDAAGHYAFPAARLAPGGYALTIRAAGFALAGAVTVEVAAGRTAERDLVMRPAADLAAQLSNTEWLQSFPGSAEDKLPLIDCMSCHTLERIARSHYDAAEFVPVLQRMANYANMSTPLHPQPRRVARPASPVVLAKIGAYLARINLSAVSSWNYPLKTLPRPAGRGTRAIVTEYAMPRATLEPHDVRMDATGMLWFSEFGEQFLGRLDPATGAVKEFAIPELKPGFPTGTLDLEPDRAGHLWLALMYQAGLARFDIASARFTLYPVQAALADDATQESMVMPGQSGVDGKVWTNLVDRAAILRLDLATGAYRLYEPFKGMPGVHSPYGLVADARNDLYFLDFGDRNIGYVDAATGAMRLYPTPTPHSRPRRGMMDGQGHLWFAEYEGNRIARFDTAKESFREWEVPEAYACPYDVAIDRNGEVWSASQTDDRIRRLDPATGRFTEYLLPHETNIRRIFVDDRTRPVQIWAGNNHSAAIVRLEPLD